jgi:hypothetical protein
MNECMCDSILEFDQSWSFFHQLYNYSKKILYETQQNIYMTRSIKCRDLRNFLEFKKIEVINFFFLIFKKLFTN